MSGLLIKILGNSLRLLVTSFISERVMLVAAYGILNKLAKSTKNSIDDKVLKLVADALKEKGYEVQ